MRGNFTKYGDFTLAYPFSFSAVVIQYMCIIMSPRRYKMKKITAVLLAIVMLVGLAACGAGGAKPDATVKKFCEGMKAFDFEAMQACMDKKFDEDEILTEEMEELASFYEYMKKSASDIKYTIGDSKVDGDNATVTVDVEYDDASELTKETFHDYFGVLFGAITDVISGDAEIEFSEDMSEEDQEKAALELFDKLFTEKQESVKIGKSNATLTFELKKADKEWKITKVSDEFADVLTANMVKAIDDLDLSDLFEGGDWEFGDYEPKDYEVDQVLYESDFARISVLSATRDEFGDYEFTILYENLTSDKSLSMGVEGIAVNGWQMMGFSTAYIDPGESYEDELGIYDDSISVLGIEDPDKVELYAYVDDADAWEDARMMEETLVIYPTGLSDSQIKVPARPKTATEKTVYDGSDYTVIALGEEVSDWSYGIRMYLKNKTDEPVYFRVESGVVNGVAAEPYGGTTLAAGAQCIFNIDFESWIMDVVKSSEHREVGLRLIASDPHDWSGEYLFTKSFSYEPDGASGVSETDLFNAFLKGEITVGVDQMFELLGPGNYTAGELCRAVVENFSNDYYEGFLDKAYYQFIDCGGDGEKELAFAMVIASADDYMGPYENYLIIKEYAGSLRVIASDYTFYRTQCDITDLGGIRSGGSDSAAAYYQEYGFIDAVGKREFVYSQETVMGLAKAIIPRYELPESILDDDYQYDLDWLEEGLEMDVYNFSKLEPDENGEISDDEYEWYQYANYYTFYGIEGQDCGPDPEVADFYYWNGINVVSHDEMRELIDERIKQLGTSEEVIYGAPIDWIEIDADTTDWMPKG